jgi:hypothetical protein
LARSNLELLLVDVELAPAAPPARLAAAGAGWWLGWLLGCELGPMGLSDALLPRRNASNYFANGLFR